jgi:hypothetical protein
VIRRPAVQGLLLLALSGLIAAASAAQQPSQPPLLQLDVSFPVADGQGGRVAYYYEIRLAPGVRANGPGALLTGIVGSGSPVEIPLQLQVAAEPGDTTAYLGTVLVVWQDGRRDSTEVRIRLPGAAGLTAPELTTAPLAPPAHPAARSSPATPPPVTDGGAAATGAAAAGASRPAGQEWASVAVGGLNKDVEVELYGTTRATSPGGLVVIRYSINSYEDQDERVRLRLVLPDGWTLLDGAELDGEFLLESWESVEGELRVQVPQDARPGERHRLHVSGYVTGEPGSAEVYSYVQLMRRGGLRPGQVGLSGTASVQAANVALERFEGARYGGVVDLSGRLSGRTSLSLNYRQGPRENNLTNFRIAQEETRWVGTLRAPGWQVQAGNQLMSMGTVLTGPSLRAQGLSLRRSEGRLIGDVLAARPTTFAGDASGHVVRASFGVNGRRGRLVGVVSDFGRPVGGYNAQPRYPEDIPPDSLEKLERERLALEKAPSNRVQGAGLEAELRAASVHRFTVRGGLLRLHNAAGDSVQDVSAEAQYTFNHRAASLNARWRSMPTSLQGVLLPGDEVSADASVRLIGELRLAGRVYRSLTTTLGNAYRAETEGASLGLRYFRSGWRVDLRGSHREWSYGQQPTTARTVTLFTGVPLGPLSFNGFADVGEQDNGTLRQPTSSYRGDLRWSGRAGSLSWSASRYTALNIAPRLRTDVLGSVKLGEWEAAGGGWATRGWTAGGDPGFWAQLGIPVTYDLLLTVGAEHAPAAWGRRPEWLGTVGLRKKLTVAVPFLRDSAGLPAAHVAPAGQ